MCVSLYLEQTALPTFRRAPRFASLRIHVPPPLRDSTKSSACSLSGNRCFASSSFFILPLPYSTLSASSSSPLHLPLLPHSTFPFVAVRLPRQSWTPLFGNFAVRCSFFCHFLYATPAAAEAAAVAAVLHNSACPPPAMLPC